MNAEPELALPGEYTLVPARTIDADRLVTFAASAWPDRRPHERVLSTWWRRADPTCAVAVVQAATGTMAAMCAVRPAEWMIAGEPVPAGAICNWFVIPAHAGKGLGKRLVRSFTKPGQFVCALYISDPAVANLKKLGWKGPIGSYLMVLPLPLLARLPLSLMAARRNVDFHDHVLSGGDDLGDLGRDLDAIEARRRKDAPDRMRRDAAEWAWRLSVCGDHRYHFSVARIAGEQAGYVVVRRTTPGTSRALGRLDAAIVVDLVGVNDDPALLRALAFRAVEIAATMRVTMLLMVTASRQHRGVLAAIGFLSPGFPLLGRILARHAPTFMWSPEGPGARFAADDTMLTFADSDADLNL
jgi:hypothetical protein